MQCPQVGQPNDFSKTNVGPDGELDTEKFLQTILIKRNTPDPLTKLSPAEIVFGRKLCDTMPRIDKSINIFFNTHVKPAWTDAWEKKEQAMRTRYQGCQTRLGEHSKALPLLNAGDLVSIQNQSGKKPTKWDRSGVVVEVRDFDKYVVKVDGSGRLTLRNRRHLRKLFEDLGLHGSPPPKSAQKTNEAQDAEKTVVPARETLLSPEAIARHIPPQTQMLLTPQPPPRLPNQSIQEPHSPDQNEQTTLVRPPYGPARMSGRPQRTISRRLTYDAAKGTYVPCNPGTSIDDQ